MTAALIGLCCEIHRARGGVNNLPRRFRDNPREAMVCAKQKEEKTAKYLFVRSDSDFPQINNLFTSAQMYIINLLNLFTQIIFPLFNMHSHNKKFRPRLNCQLCLSFSKCLPKIIVIGIELMVVQKKSVGELKSKKFDFCDLLQLNNFLIVKSESSLRCYEK